METYFIYAGIGLICGVFSSLFGVGAGIILIPLLVILVGVDQKSAQGISLAVMVPMTFVGALIYYRSGDLQMDPKIILPVALFAVAGSLVGANIALNVPSHVLRKMFAAVLLVAAFKLILTPGVAPETESDENGPKTFQEHHGSEMEEQNDQADG